jgi:pimeloyl-ACP methyl ester carboxylesterase
MPTVTVNGTELHYEDTGGPGETLLFSHGLLWNTALFAPQMAALRDRWRCVAYDHRGQGRSADDPRKVIDMDLLTDDAVALIGALGLGRVHFCGLSMGGFVGMRLAARHPRRVRSLILCDTSAEPEPPENAPKYKRMNLAARWLGPRVVMPQVMPILFGKTALTDPARAADRRAWQDALNRNRRSIWRAVNGVILREPVLAELPNITAPTLVLVGDEDVATVPAKAQRIASGIPNARLEVIPQAGHSSTVENPAAVNAAIERFLGEVGAAA